MCDHDIANMNQRLNGGRLTVVSTMTTEVKHRLGITVFSCRDKFSFVFADFSPIRPPEHRQKKGTCKVPSTWTRDGRTIHGARVCTCDRHVA